MTAGFRDVLHIMRQDRPRLYDYLVQRPPPLVPRDLRFEINERMLYTGEVRTPIAEEQTRVMLRYIAELGILDIAVCLLHCYANPHHERLLGSWIAQDIPGARVSLSSDILCEFKGVRENEYHSSKHLCTTARIEICRQAHHRIDWNRYPVCFANYAIERGLRIAAAAQKHAVQTVLSGPAAGALTGLRLCLEAGLRNMISIDVGGTSADVALAYDAKLQFAEETEISGHTIKIPMIEIHTVGAGGGSIGWVDSGGRFK